MNRFQNMLNAGYQPGIRYGSSPLCYCGKKPTHLVRVSPGQLDHVCAEHYQAWKVNR